ncbi:MAG TPA: hypothetical protein VGC47_12605 [Acidimicrobiia bacterium]|jgi:hypothetical protein
MNRYLTFGLRQLFGGARRGQPYVAGLGAAIALVSWLRERSAIDGSPIYRRTLREGEAVTIRLLRGEAIMDETVVEG